VQPLQHKRCFESIARESGSLAAATSSPTTKTLITTFPGSKLEAVIDGLRGRLGAAEFGSKRYKVGKDVRMTSQFIGGWPAIVEMAVKRYCAIEATIHAPPRGMV
jgi:hypothetical protein